MKPYDPAPRSSGRLLKVIALLQLGLAIVRLVIEQASWPSVSMSIVGALLMIFCAREKVNDERVEHLKLKAAKVGLLVGTLLVMLTQLGATMAKWGPAQPSGPGLPPMRMPLSAFDALSLVMLITLGCYYYWRWQDGRAEPAS